MASQFIKNEIRRCYTEEDSKSLASRLEISLVNLRKIASRMHLKKGTKANAIMNGTKRCCICEEYKPLSHYWHDSAQPNFYDYRCISCREKEIQERKMRHNLRGTGENDNKKCHNHRGSMAFGVNKKHNPIIMIEDEHGNIIKGKRCKGCKINKPLTAFNKLHKEDSDDTENRKNICKECLKNKRKGNNKNGVCKNEM